MMPVDCDSCPPQIKYAFTTNKRYLCANLSNPNGSPLVYTGRSCGGGRIEWAEFINIEIMTWDQHAYSAYFCRVAIKSVVDQYERGYMPDSKRAKYFGACGVSPPAF